MFSKPGSLTPYTTAPRGSIISPSGCPDEVAPNSYSVDYYSIKALPETLPPFDTTEQQHKHKVDDLPGPGSYDPEKLQFSGSAIIRPGGERMPKSTDETPGAGPAYNIGSEWDRKTLQTYHQCNTMRPRVPFPQHVSNNVPSVSHPLEIRCFVQGGDYRMYPWRDSNRIHKQPGPIYDTFQIYTSESKISPVIDFASVAERGDTFRTRKGAGPAEYNTRLPLNPNGGIFLSKSNDPKRSALRLIELIYRDACKPHPGPGSYSVQRDMDSPSPKACTAPFKSKVPTLGFSKKPFGPSPQAHFRTDMTMDDMAFPIWPYPQRHLPPRAPFLNTAKRFADPANRENCYRVPPNKYRIRGFTDNMQMDMCNHRSAISNPKLGFLTSAEARGKEVMTFRLDAIRGICDPETIPGIWRDLKPPKRRTYPVPIPCPQLPDIPGPIYETASGAKAIKGRRDFFDPREWTGTGFNNSGCGRKTKVSNNPVDLPGPKYLVPSFFPGPGGRINMTGKREMDSQTPGPGPNKMLHEKCDSMWRATQLGSFNTHLKGLGTIRPSAGGYHPRGPIDDLAENANGYLRMEDCPDAYMHQKQPNET